METQADPTMLNEIERMEVRIRHLGEQYERAEGRPIRSETVEEQSGTEEYVFPDADDL